MVALSFGPALWGSLSAWQVSAWSVYTPYARGDQCHVELSESGSRRDWGALTQVPQSFSTRLSGLAELTWVWHSGCGWWRAGGERPSGWLATRSCVRRLNCTDGVGSHLLAMPLKRGKLKQKARLVVDLAALPRNHFHCLVSEEIRELGFGFKDPAGNHWPRIVSIEDDSAVVESEPRVVVGCEVISLNGSPVVGLTHEQALPLLKKRPLELVFCEPNDHTEQEGERRALPAGLAAASMRLDSGQPTAQKPTNEAKSPDDDFFGFGDVVDNPLDGAGPNVGSAGPNVPRFSGASTFDVEDAPSNRRSKKDSRQWQDVEKQDPSLYRWGDEDDDIGGNPDTIPTNHDGLKRAGIHLGAQAVDNSVNGINMYKKRQRQHHQRVLCVAGCLVVLVTYWISLFIAGHSTHVDGCTSYCEEHRDAVEEAGSA